MEKSPDDAAPDLKKMAQSIIEAYGCACDSDDLLSLADDCLNFATCFLRSIGCDEHQTNTPD